MKGCKVDLPCTPFIKDVGMDDFYYAELFDLYKGLLTETQRRMFHSHYFLDLSLAETGEEFGMARQSVYDAVKKVKEKLAEYERILKFHDKKRRIEKLLWDENEDLGRKVTEILEE